MHRQGQPLPAGLAFRGLGYHVFSCRGHSVAREHLSLVLLLSGFAIGPKPLSFIDLKFLSAK